MSVMYLLTWWYGDGWKQQFNQIGRRLSKVGKAFSGGTLLRTLFSPWKQLVSGTQRDAALADKLRAVLDNIVSRFVGFMVRFITLVTALVTLVLVFIFNVFIVLAWPVVPVLPVILLFVWTSL